MQSSIRKWLGEERPKQYCTFTGTRSMLRHTWDRALALAPYERLVTVVARGHHPFLQEEEHAGGIPGTVLEQPQDRGTAIGVLYPLSLVLARDPRGVVLILPADHYIQPEGMFLRLAASACLMAQKLHRPVLLAAVPDSAETDYGWILPHRPRSAGLGSSLQPIKELHEKPPPEKARELLDAGGLWSTMIAAAPAEVLWELAEQRLPPAAAQLRALGPLLGRADERFPLTASDLVASETTYRTLPTADFSRDLLAQCQHNCPLVLPLLGVEWSDWGRPERITRSLARLGASSKLRLHDMTSGLQADAVGGG
jgi:mannose-1-phosphate guanylyltransferase